MKEKRKCLKISPILNKRDLKENILIQIINFVYINI